VAAAAALIAASLGQERGRVRALAALAAGALLVVLPYEAYFVAKGALGDQLFQTWTMASYGALRGMPMPWDTLAFLFNSDSRTRWVTAILPAAFAVGCVLVVERLWRSPRTTIAAWDERREVRAAVFTLAIALGFTFIDHQAFPDKFTIVPFMAVAAGWIPFFAADALRPIGESARRIPIVVTISYVLAAAYGGIEGMRNTDVLAIQREVAAKVRSPDPEQPNVWAVGCLHLLAFNRQANFTQVGALFDARVREAVGADYRPLRDGRMPRVVLTARLGKKIRPAWLTDEYANLTPHEFDEEGVNVWLRRSDTGAGAGAPPSVGAGVAADAEPSRRRRVILRRDLPDSAS
jgi:hypothetical protein